MLDLTAFKCVASVMTCLKRWPAKTSQTLDDIHNIAIRGLRFREVPNIRRKEEAIQ